MIPCGYCWIWVSLYWLLLSAGAFRSETGSLVLKNWSQKTIMAGPMFRNLPYVFFSWSGGGRVSIGGITTILNPSHSKTWNSQRRFSSFYLGLLVSVPSPGKDGCSIPIHSWESKNPPVPRQNSFKGRGVAVEGVRRWGPLESQIIHPAGWMSQEVRIKG